MSHSSVENSIFPSQNETLYSNSYYLPDYEHSSVNTFSPFLIQNEIITPRSPATKSQWPISSQRSVKTVATQTDSPIPVFCSVATQTSVIEDNTVFVKSLEFLLHAETVQPNMPIIQLSLNKIPQNFLLDSGASISLLSMYFFQQIKDHVHYTRISSNVKITTVNSAVICSGCIKLSFKIGKVFYKHPFFLIDIPEHSKFVGILGFDFLKTHRVVIDLHNNKVKINSNLLEILDSVPPQEVEETQELQLNTIFHQTHSDDALTDESADQNCLITDNNALNTDNSESLPSNNVCHLKKKVVILPNSTVYVPVVSSFLSNDKQFLFEPKIQDVPTCSYQSIITTEASVNSNKNHNIEFSIPITNNSNDSVHINKQTVLGSIQEIEHVASIPSLPLTPPDPI